MEYCPGQGDYQSKSHHRISSRHTYHNVFLIYLKCMENNEQTEQYKWAVTP